MSPREQNLLLTVARIMRARLRNDMDAWARDDYMALKEALTPFDGIQSEPINEELR